MLPAVKYLVEEMGADVNAVDHDGNTAVHHAASRGDNAMIALPRREGRRREEDQSRPARRPWMWPMGRCSARSRIPETIELLESLGAINNNKCVSC